MTEHMTATMPQRYRVLTMALVLCGVLAGACGGPSTDSPEALPGADAGNIPAARRVPENEFGPDVTLVEAEDGSLDVPIWALINAADPYGIAVQGVKTDDVVTIESIGGIAWFSDQSGWGRVLSTIYAVTDALVPTGPIKSVIQASRPQIVLPDDKKTRDPDPSKAHDGYGRDMDGGNYAQNEGGIIVCMPSARGPMYAHDKNHLEAAAASAGRFEDYLSSDMKDKCFFPTRIDRENGENGTLRSARPQVADQDGVLHILAFDSIYDDNAGSYEVKFRIKRSPGP